MPLQNVANIKERYISLCMYTFKKVWKKTKFHEKMKNLEPCRLSDFSVFSWFFHTFLEVWIKKNTIPICPWANIAKKRKYLIMIISIITDPDGPGIYKLDFMTWNSCHSLKFYKIKRVWCWGGEGRVDVIKFVSAILRL